MIQGFRHGGAYGPGAGMGRLRGQFQQQALDQQRPQQLQQMQRLQQMRAGQFGGQQQAQQLAGLQAVQADQMSPLINSISGMSIPQRVLDQRREDPSGLLDRQLQMKRAFELQGAGSGYDGGSRPLPPGPPYGGGPGFAKPLSPPSSSDWSQTGGGGGGQGGAPPTSWKMSIEPMAYGGIIGLRGGGYIPMYAGGGIPGYWGGGFLRGLGKVISKVAPAALSFIPGASGLSGLAKAGIGALAQGAGDIASDKGFNLQRMLGGAGRTYALSSAVDRLRNIEGLEGEGLWGSLGKVLTDKDVGKEAMEALADIPFGEAMALAVTEKAGERGAQQQAQDAGGFTGMVSPMGTTGRVMPGSGGADLAGGYASQMTYGQQPIDYSQPDSRLFGGGVVPAFQEGGEYEDEDEAEGGREPYRYRSSRGSSRRRAPAPPVGRRKEFDEPIAPPPSRRRAPTRRVPRPVAPPPPVVAPPLPVEGDEFEEPVMPPPSVPPPSVPPPVVAPPPLPPPVARDIPEDIEEFVPETVAAMRPPPPPVVAPPPPVAAPAPIIPQDVPEDITEPVVQQITPTAPAVQSVAQQLRDSGLVPLTPPPPPPPPKAEVAARKKAAAARKAADKKEAAAKKRAKAEKKRAADARAVAKREKDTKKKAAAERKAAAAEKKAAAAAQAAAAEAKRVTAAKAAERKAIEVEQRVITEREQAPPPPAPPVEDEFDEPMAPPSIVQPVAQQIAPLIPRTPMPPPPPPPPVVPPPPVGDEFDEPIAPPPIQQPQPPPGVPVFDPMQVDVANQQAELAAQQQAASRRQPPPPPIFDRIDEPDELDEPPPVPRPRAQPQPQPKPFVDDEEPIDQQLASQLPYTIPQPQGPQPPPGVPVFDPTQVDLRNAIEQQEAQARAVAQGAKPFVPSPEEEKQEEEETWRPEPTVRVNVPEQLTAKQRDDLDETMFAPDDTDTVERHEGPEATFTPDTGRPTPVIEPPAGVQVFDPNKVVKADEEATTTALENMLKMDPDNEDARKRLERKYEKRDEAAAREVEKTGVLTGPMRAAVPTPTTTAPPPPLATRAGSGAGSGFYGEQKWFDPNAPDPAKRDIGGFSPHELPRTSADFAAAGDTGGAGLLDRLNAPAAPVQNYLSPVPVPGAAEGGLISQVPMEDLEKLARAAQQIESPGSQQIIEQAIDDYGLELVQQIIKAIQEQGPMMAPDGAVPEYGMARGGLINGGGGDAMADDILVNAEMGMNGERQDIAVSAGEYIVPGDVLAHLGSGNTSEGGEVMDQFIEDVRVQRTGSPEQPPPIDLRDVLPGTYGGRYE